VTGVGLIIVPPVAVGGEFLNLALVVVAVALFGLFLMRGAGVRLQRQNVFASALFCLLLVFVVLTALRLWSLVG
jgi:Ca2+/Na+ antiporter